MAVVLSDKEKEDQNKVQSVVTDQPISQTQSSGIATASSAKPTSSGRFTNLQSYLKANQPQQGGMAAQIGQKFQQEGEQLKGQIQEAGKQFGEQAGQFAQGAQQQGQQFIQQIQQDPTKISNVPEFEQARDIQYSGPQQLQNLYNLQSQATQLGQLGQLSGSEAGRSELLRQMYKSPTYSQGQVALDQALIQANPEQLAKIKAVQGIAKSAGRELGAGQKTALEQLQQAQAQALATRSGIRGALDVGATDILKSLGTQLVGAKEARSGLQTSAEEQLKNLNISDELLSQLGLSRGSQLYGLTGKDLSQYLNKSQLPTSESQVMTPEQYSKINALKKLAGSTAGQEASKTYETLANEAAQKSAEEYAASKPYEYDKEQLAGLLGGQKANYEQQHAAQTEMSKQAANALFGSEQLAGQYNKLQDKIKLNQALNPTFGNIFGDLTDDERNLINRYNFEKQKFDAANQALLDLPKKYGGTIQNYKNPINTNNPTKNPITLNG